MALPLTPPIPPMLVKLARTLPDGDHAFEPKLDGFRAIVFRDGDAVEVQSRHGNPLARYFPELVEAVRALEVPRIVLDGEIVAETAPFTALMARLHPAPSRVAILAEETPARFAAFDLLALGDGSVGLHVLVPLAGEPFARTKAFARELAGRLSGVVTTQRRGARAGRVLVDWLQNDPTRSLIAPWSLRATTWPTVSAPVEWQAVERCAREERPERLVLDWRDALDRLERHEDALAPALGLRQTL